jgi:hypothetical protein
VREEFVRKHVGRAAVGAWAGGSVAAFAWAWSFEDWMVFFSIWLSPVAVGLGWIVLAVTWRLLSGNRGSW